MLSTDLRRVLGLAPGGEFLVEEKFAGVLAQEERIVARC